MAFCAVADEPVLALTTELTARHILAALLAGAVYFVVNNGLVATAVALSTGLALTEMLADDVRFQLATSSILLGLAPVTAHAANFSVFMLPLLLLPMLGVHSNARMALNRQREALHDNLTGLPNREFFRRRAEKALLTSEARARPGDHDPRPRPLQGDQRHARPPRGGRGPPARSRPVGGHRPAGGHVARLGGDEFAAVLAEVRAAGRARAGRRDAERLREPIVVDGVRMGVQASIGISMAPGPRRAVQTLLKRADIALYRAKSARGDVQVYRPEIDRHTVGRRLLLGDLHAAVDQDEFVLALPAAVCTRTRRRAGRRGAGPVDAPAHGLIGPDVFIPLAENSGLIAPLSRWGIELAWRSWRRWRARATTSPCRSTSPRGCSAT